MITILALLFLPLVATAFTAWKRSAHTNHRVTLVAGGAISLRRSIAWSHGRIRFQVTGGWPWTLWPPFFSPSWRTPSFWSFSTRQVSCDEWRGRNMIVPSASSTQR